SVASCVLNPEWRDTATLETVLAELGWQSEQPAAVPVASVGPYAQTRFAQCRDLLPLAGTPIVPVSPRPWALFLSPIAIPPSGDGSRSSLLRCRWHLAAPMRRRASRSAEISFH